MIILQYFIRPKPFFLRLCLDWWYAMEWNGMWWNKIMFHCLDITKMNGMTWNMMVCISSYSIVYTHFTSPPIWKVWNGMTHYFNLIIYYVTILSSHICSVISMQVFIQNLFTLFGLFFALVSYIANFKFIFFVLFKIWSVAMYLPLY
jgi:hypothetical protein